MVGEAKQHDNLVKPSQTRQWSSLKPTVMVGDKNNKTRLVNNRDIPKTQRVSGSTNIVKDYTPQNLPSYNSVT